MVTKSTTLLKMPIGNSQDGQPLRTGAPKGSYGKNVVGCMNATWRTAILWKGLLSSIPNRVEE